MILTEQQNNFITAAGRAPRIIINAKAGTGKTSTLLENVKRSPKKKFLLIVFSKPLAVETEAKAKKMRLRNLTVKTVHSLAFSEVFANKWKVITSLKYYDLDKYDIKDHQYDTWKLFSQWMENSDASWSVTARRYPGHSKEAIIRANKLIKAMKKKGASVLHGFYLKAYMIRVLSNPDFTIKKYDVLLLDEAQDTSRTASAFFNHIQMKQKIKVGDTNQAIFGFLNLANEMNEKEGWEEFPLTKSFRLIKGQGTIAKSFMEGVLLEPFDFEGVNPGNDKKGTACILTRTNAALIGIFVNMIKQDKITAIKLKKKPSELYSTLFDIKELVMKGKGTLTKINKELSAYNKGLSDANKLTMSQYLISDDMREKIYEVYSSARVYFSHDWGTIIKSYHLANKLYSLKSAKVEATTGHTSKGLEWDVVKLTSDWMPLKDLVEFVINYHYSVVNDVTKLSYKQGMKLLVEHDHIFLQEINLIYVALTRAKYQVKGLSTLGYLDDVEDVANEYIAHLRKQS